MYIVQLDFECMRYITNILFYSGIQWYACISNSIKSFLEVTDYNFLSNSGIKVMPVRNGVSTLRVCNSVSVWIMFEEENKDNVNNWLSKIMNTPVLNINNSNIQFSINGSLSLKKHTNIADNKAFSLESEPISRVNWQDEIEALKGLTEITIHLITPLRLKRPNEFKVNGHKFFDEDYFDIQVFVEQIARYFHDTCPDMKSVEMIDKSFSWIDMIYKNSIGGIMGTVKLQGQFSDDLLELLVKGQYAGIGKNSSFGFGQYRIKETSPVRKISFSQTQSLYNRLTDRFFLESVLESMDKEIVDFDGITYSDVMDEKNHFINSLRSKIENRTYQTSETQTFRKKKRNGQYRTIVVNNFTDRFVYKALSKLLSEAFENIFCENSFAYRVGYGHHKAVDKFLFYKSKGYQYGIKTDIEAFFDSIPLSKIYMLIRSFLFDDQITDFLESIIPADKVGLDQGNALSPLFSNIYMVSFDTAIKNSPYVMIRYADDFVILSKTKQDNLYEFTENILKKMNLKLSLEKSVHFEPDSQVEFLGYMIEKDKAHKTGTIDNTDITWTHMFDRNKLSGMPVYISYYNSYVRTEREMLIIETDKEKRKIPWKEIQRIVIIGKPRVSAAVIQKAMDQNKPIQFLTILGDTIGGFTKHQKWLNVKEFVEKRGQQIDQFALQFIKSIVKAKLHNQKHILRKNGIKSDLMKELIMSLKTIDDVDVIRGKEGAGSAEYFKHYRLLVDPLPFEKREYYPPVGPVNAMLSLGYTLIYNRVCESLISHGFYPYEGLYHAGKGNHKALASDLMEPFRFISERIVLHLIHTNQISDDDFTEIQTSSGKCTRIHGDGFRKYINRFEWMMNQEIKVKGKNLNFYCLLDESVKSLYKSIVLGIQYNPFFLN